MSNRVKHLLLTLVIGVAGCLALVAIQRSNNLSIGAAQLLVSDAFMVRDGGPRFGSRAASKDIVLVLFDGKTAKELGHVHSYPEDLKLYQKLSEAGASVIYDTRMVAAAEGPVFEDLKILLDGMNGIRKDGSLMRDIWLSSAIQNEQGAAYAMLMIPQVLNSRPHAIPDLVSRFYPLVSIDARGVNETAPLAISRQFWKIPRTTNAEAATELVRSGIKTVWHQMAPDIVNESTEPKSNFRVGDHEVTWYPFQSINSLVAPAGFWVSYDPPFSGYERVSMIDVLHDNAASKVKDKIVIVGYAADMDPTSDVYEIPSSLGRTCSAEVVAYATQTILDGKNMREIPPWIRLLIGTLLILACALVAGLTRPLYAVTGVLLLLSSYYTGAVLAYRSDWFSDFLVLPAVAFLTAVSGGTLNAWASLRARQRIIDMFGRYVPRAIVNQLVQRSDLRSLMLGGLNREVTVMFADVRGFTDFSQDLAPEAVVNELNSLLEKMVACTFEQEGTLDKFIGDAILVLFNAPLNQPDHSLRAVRTAINIQKELANHPSGLRIGIGVHRGLAVVGNIGTPQRMEYTAIGSTVNIASRLCDQAAPGEIVISQAVIDHLGDSFSLGEISSVQVKGIKSALNIARIKTV